MDDFLVQLLSSFAESDIAYVLSSFHIFFFLIAMALAVFVTLYY